ncbi:MAG: hypothetical protein AB1505_33525 [Candidatus Latescibacterota bacterium]
MRPPALAAADAALVATALSCAYLIPFGFSELLRRPGVRLDPARVTAYLQDPVVLVTGTAGSIIRARLGMARTSVRTPCVGPCSSCPWC